MKIPTTFDNCIVCLKEPAESSEHFIPRFIGGNLQAKILCKKCNSNYGSNVVSKLKNDPFIFHAIEYFKFELPDLYKSFNKKRAYVGKSTDGTEIKMVKDGNNLRIIPQKGEGILELDNNDASIYIERRLRRSGSSENDIQRFSSLFNNASEGEKITLPTGELLSKIPISEVRKEIPIDIITERFWVLVAFEFLSLVIGNNIYNEFFNNIRLYLQYKTDKAPVEVKKFQGKKYEAIHGVMIEPFESYLVIHIRLFRWIAISVKFENVHYPFNGLVFLDNLKTHDCEIAFHKDRHLISDWYRL
jgi:hypothetical protein